MFQHAGEPDAAVFAAPSGLAPARFEAVIVGKRQRLVEDRPEIAAVIGGADRGPERHGGSGNEIAPPQRGWIQPADARGLLDDALEHVVCFRPAGAAIGRGRDRVGESAPRADVDVLDVVERRQTAGEIQGRDVSADRADIRAEIGGVADAQCEKAAVLVECELGFRVEIARLVVAEKCFRAARHPVHRPAELFGGDQLRNVFGIGAGLQAESATDIVSKDAQPLLGDLHDDRDRIAHRRRALRADAQRVAVGCRIVARGGAARLHGGDRHPLIGHGDAGDKSRAREDIVDAPRVGLRILRQAGPIDGEIAGDFRPDLRRAGSERGAGVDHGRQRLILDRDQFGGVLGGGSGLGDHHGDGFADMHRPLAGERGPVRQDQGLAAAPGERWMAPEARDPFHVFRRQHAEHAGRTARGGYVDADNPRKGMRRTDEIGIRLARFGDIGRVAALSAHQNVVFHARRVGRTAIRFCIHALFRDICLDKAHPLINPKQPPAKAAFLGFFVGNAFLDRFALRRGRYASGVPG